MAKVKDQSSLFERRTPVFYLLRSLYIAFVFSVMFVSCDLPESTDELDNPMPAVWALLSPKDPIKVYITSVVPYNPDDSTQQSSELIDDAVINLTWNGGEISFHYNSSDESYSPDVDSFRVSPGVTYTLSGQTSMGNFSNTFTVPEVPEIYIYGDTSYFDYSRNWAFALSTSRNARSYEIFVNQLEDLGEWIPFSGDCPIMWWSDETITDTIAIPWCELYEEGKYEVVFRVGEENYYEYATYYKYSDITDGGGDDYRSPPGGNGYAGVIGAYTECADTVWVLMY